MAKKDTRIIDVSGLSIKDIMDIDLQLFNVLSERDLRAITSRLVSASNKRIRSLKERGISSPALRGLGTQDVFSTKLPEDIDPRQRVNKLRQEFARARNFLQMKTSTIKGYHNYEKQIREGLESEIGRKLSDDEIAAAFRVLHKLQNSGKVAGLHSAGSQHAKEQIFQMLAEDPNAFDDDLMKDTTEEYTEFYDKNPESQFTIISDKE